MSHIVAIKTQFRDLALLKQAFAAYGWSIKQDSVIRTYSSAESKVVYKNIAVNPAGKYDIGIKEEDGVYDLDVDFYDTSISKQLGDNFGQLAKLKKKYTQMLIEQEYEEQGYTTQTTMLPNGAIKVSILN